MSGYNLGEARGKIVLETDLSGLKDAQKGLDEFQTNSKKVDGSLLSTQDALKKTSNTSLIAGGVIAAGFAVAVKSAGDFEFQMSAIQAVSGATTDEMKQISDAALRIGADTAFSSAEAGQAMEELVKAGISVKDTINGAADATVALAAAGGVDLPTAATIAANAMNQFGLSAKDLVAVTDTVAGAANASAISVEEYATAMAQVGAVANLAGLSFEDTSIAIAAMGNAGIKGSDAGTSLKSMLMRLIPTTDEATGLMKELGLMTEDGANQFYNAEGHLKSLAEVSDILGNSLKGMTDEQKQATLTTLFGADAIRGAAVLADQGAAGVNKLADAMGKVSAADVAKTRLDNMNGSIEALKGSAETLGIQVGSILVPRIKELTDKLTEAVNWFSSLSGGQQAAIVTTAQVAAGLLLGVGAAIKIALALQGASKAMAAYKASQMGIAAAEKASAVAKGIATGAQWLLNAAMTANPIGIVVVAIAALVAGLVWFFTQTKLGQEIWANFTRFLGEAWTNIVSFVTSAVDTVVSFVSANWGLLLSLLIGPLGLVIQWIVENWGKIVSFFQPAIDAIVAVFQGLWSVVSAVWNGIMAVIGFVIGAIVAYFTMWWTVVTTVVGAISAAIGAMVAWWMANVLPVIVAFIGMIVAIFQYLGLWVAFIWNAIVAAISAAVTAVVAVVVAIWGALVGFITPIFQAIWDFILFIFTMIVAGITAYVNLVVSIITTVWGAIYGFVAPIFQAIWDFLVSVFQGIWDFISGIVSSVVDTIVGAWESLTGTVSGIFEGVKSAIEDPLEDALDFISGIQDKVVGFFSDAGTWLVGAGEDIINGFIDGLENMLGGIADFFSGVTANVPKQKGPAPVDKVLLKPAGKLIMQGLLSGLQSEQSKVMDMLHGMNVTIPATLNTSMAAGIGSRLPVQSATTSPQGKLEQNFTIVTDSDPTVWARAVGREFANGMAG